MKYSIPSFLRLAVFSLVFAWGTAALAASAQDYLKTKQSELTALIQDSSAEGQKKLTKTFDELLDYDALARDSLADQWGKLTPDQQKEFQGLLVTLVQRAYTKNLKDTLNYDVAFKGQDDAARGKLVRTLASHKTDKRKEPISIDYLVHEKGGKWQVIDIVTEGSSLVANYKSQFRKLIEKKGVSGLLERMKEKAAEK